MTRKQFFFASLNQPSISLLTLMSVQSSLDRFCKRYPMKSHILYYQMGLRYQ